MRVEDRLAVAITTVRGELQRTIAEGERSALVFRAGPVEMEFQVSFSKTGSTEAPVRASVISAGAKGELQLRDTSPHPLLTPVQRSEGRGPDDRFGWRPLA
jgi:hypothetical protein